METVNDTKAPSDPPPYKQPGQRLHRSTDDKVVSGLAGGLGRYFGIDPVVFRIAFVVLTFAGGSGVLLYLVGWLMVPDDQYGTALGRFGGERRTKLLAAVLAGVGVLILVDNLSNRNGDVPFGVVLVGLGGLYLWSRRDGAASGGGGSPIPPAPPSGPAGGSDRAPAPAGPVAVAPETDREAPAPDAGGAAPESEPPTLLMAVAEPPTVPFRPAPAPRPAKEPKPRSVLVPVTLSLLAVLAGGLSLVGASVTTGLGLALLLTGGALIFGAWRGRAKWLIPVGLVLAVSLAAASLIDVPVRGGTGDVAFRPVALDEIRTPYRLAAGQLVLDLTAVDFQGQTVTVVASVAAGHLDVLVPTDVALDIDAHVGAGDLQLLGRETDGADVGRQVADPGREGAGRLVLRARAGFGLVEVRRAAA